MVIDTDTQPAREGAALPCGPRRASTHLLQLRSNCSSLIASWHGQVLSSLQPEQLEAVPRAGRVGGGLGSQVQVADLKTEARAVLWTGVAYRLQGVLQSSFLLVPFLPQAQHKVVNMLANTCCD